MEVKDYRKRKQNGKVKFVSADEHSVVALSARFDPFTGEQLSDGVTHLNITGLKNDLANVDKQIADMQELRADLAALTADAEAEAAKAKPAKK